MYEETSFNLNFLSNKKIIKEIEKNISFSKIEIDYRDDLSYLFKIRPKDLENLGTLLII